MARDAIADLSFERPEMAKSFDLSPDSPGLN